MSHFTNIAGCRDTAEGDAETKDEAAGQEHAVVHRGRLNTGAQDDDASTSKHTHPAAIVVVDRSCQEDGRDWIRESAVSKSRLFQE